jgi:LEA14-like dessication related protein
MRKIATLLFLSAICGCVTMQSPNVTLADLRIVDLTLFEQSYALKIRIQNPNSVALPITGMHFELDVNSAELGRGVSDQSVTVPAYGEAVMEIKVVSNLARVFDQIRGLENSKAQDLRYRLTGDIRVANRLGRLPFDYQGQIGLQR